MERVYTKVHGSSMAALMRSAYERAYDEGWTDGLPIIPATDEDVDLFVRAAHRPADEIVGIVPPRKGPASIEAIAVNAIMAGCRPEYMPVIVAAMEGLLDPGFPLEPMQVSTNAMTPFLLINGPVRQLLDVNSGIGCLGPGWRANATIGRAIRLILTNVGGALPGVYSKSTFSSPLRYSYLCGENEEESPWPPFHVEHGYSCDQSTVTVFRAANFCNISGGEGIGAEEILRHIASNMPPASGGGGVLLLLGVNHTQSLHEAGYDKAVIRRRLWELARFPAELYAQAFADQQRRMGRGDARTIWRAKDPDEIRVVVAGGPGPQDIYISAGLPQTRLVHMRRP
jgi:hypothetical protein